MDQNEMKLVAHFKSLFAKELNVKFDLVKFANDNAYAKQILEQAAQSTNEDLLVITMELMKRRGLLTEKNTEADKPADKVDQKYIGRLR